MSRLVKVLAIDERVVPCKRCLVARHDTFISLQRDRL